MCDLWLALGRREDREGARCSPGKRGSCDSRLQRGWPSTLGPGPSLCCNGGALGEARMGDQPRDPFHLSPLYPVLQQVPVIPPQKHTPGPSPPHPSLGDSDRLLWVSPLPACLLTAATTSANQTMSLSHPLKEELSPQAAPTQPDGTHFQWLSQQTTPNMGDLKQHKLFPFPLTVLEGPGLTRGSVG